MARNLLRSFPPVASPDARVLILGSMPGQASLQAGQYYAHPRNLFWHILGDLLRLPLAELPYPQRVAVLLESRIAVWDVLHSCERKGSLDSAIAPDSIQANDFAPFFCQHPMIVCVLFNGNLAEKSFLRHVRPHLGEMPDCRRLPSTSPAYAALTYKRKLELWRQGLQSAGLEMEQA